MYRKIKKLKGERFAQTLRNHHNGLLEIPELDDILRHAGNDAEPLLPYLMTLLPSNDDEPMPVPVEPQDPFALLEQAGYHAFYADTLEKQNSIKPHFQKSELLCTFNDHARYQNYHIVHAVRKDAGTLRRKDFRGNEDRQDAYGTSVISIQILKAGGFISIKNRYNHAVLFADNTFNSNPDNIIEGLSAALQTHFNVEFSSSKSSLPEGYVLIGKQIFKYHREFVNIYYGDQAWAQNGEIHEADRASGDALLGEFLFRNKTKTLIKIDRNLGDTFADAFNRHYGGNKGLHVQNGNLMLKGEVLIGAEQSRIKTLYLPAFIKTSDNFLDHCGYTLTHFEAPALTTIGHRCLANVPNLTHFVAPSLTRIGDWCLGGIHPTLKHFHVSVALKKVPAHLMHLRPSQPNRLSRLFAPLRRLVLAL